MALQRVVVIVNKKWEAAPILGVFRAPYAAGSLASARPAEWQPGKPYPAPQAWPDASGQYTFDYRYTLLFGTARVECWCLADFEDTSDSGKKSAYIPQILASGYARPCDRGRHGGGARAGTAGLNCHGMPGLHA